MTERMNHVLAADRLVSALAERRTIESDDRVTMALAALVAEIDGTEIPVLDLPGDPASAPFKRRAGVAAVTIAALAFSSGGIAAAVTGDPLLPLRYVVGKLYEHAYPEGETDSDRWFVGRAQGGTADPVAIQYASLTQSLSSERFAGLLTGSGPDGPGADPVADSSQFGSTPAGDGTRGDVVSESSDTDAAADETAADPGPVAGDEPASEAPGATPETPAPDEPPTSLPGEPSPESPAPPSEEDPEILTGTPGAPSPDRPGGDRSEHGRDDDVVATHTEPGKPADPGKPVDPGKPADGRPGEDGGHGGQPDGHTPPAQPDAEVGSEPGRPAGPPGPPANLPTDRGPLSAAEDARHAPTAPKAR